MGPVPPAPSEFNLGCSRDLYADALLQRSQISSADEQDGQPTFDNAERQ